MIVERATKGSSRDSAARSYEKFKAIIEANPVCLDCGKGRSTHCKKDRHQVLRGQCDGCWSRQYPEDAASRDRAVAEGYARGLYKKPVEQSRTIGSLERKLLAQRFLRATLAVKRPLAAKLAIARLLRGDS
jgi:hypothetical protein